jgi:hypothetical protein
MVPGAQPAVRTDGTFCPDLNVRGEVSPAQVPSRVWLEEDSFISALIALHEFFLFLFWQIRDV